MLAPILATEDPYAAASVFRGAGWKVEYESARGGPYPSASVSLAQARVVLIGATMPADLPRGVGAEFRVHVSEHEISGLFLLHRAAGLALSEPRRLPSGKRAFRAEIVGYRFLLVEGDPDPDLALIATDPRIATLADGLRRSDAGDGLSDAALLLAESSGDSIKSLRLALRSGLPARDREIVGEDLADVVIAAAVLARQLGVNLQQRIDGRLGSAAWHVPGL